MMDVADSLALEPQTAIDCLKLRLSGSQGGLWPLHSTVRTRLLSVAPCHMAYGSAGPARAPRVALDPFEAKRIDTSASSRSICRCQAPIKCLVRSMFAARGGARQVLVSREGLERRCIRRDVSSLSSFVVVQRDAT